MASLEPGLQLRDVWASYGPRKVLSGMTLKVSPGEIVAMLGHNGAGKTTALRVAAGVKAPDSGSVRLDGSDVARLGASARARAGVALMPEGVAGIFPTLTVAQNLAAIAQRGDRGSAATEAEKIAAPFDVMGILRGVFADVLVERRDQVAGSMSGGQRQMLAVSIALARNPTVLLLDEPSTGLAPLVVERIFRTVADIAAETQTAVVIVEQDIANALKIATRVEILHTGRIVASFKRDEFPAVTELWHYF